MTIAAVIEMIQILLGVAQAVTTGGAHNDTLIAESLIKIAQAAQQGYEAHTGEPMDIAQIRPEAQI